MQRHRHLNTPMESSGGTAALPLFPNGDVILIIPVGNVYKLHSDILRRCSGFFADHLTEENGAKLKRAAERSGVHTRYKFDLTPSVEQPHGVFQMKQVDHFGRPLPDMTQDPQEAFAGVHGYRISEKTCNHWKILLGAFYGVEPEIAGGGEGLQAVLESCILLLDIAESIRAVPVIRQSVDIALMRQGQMLYQSIATNPVDWGNLAVRIQSPTIFKEAVVHLVGKWHSMRSAERNRLTPSLRALCKKKEAHWDMVKRAAEIRCLGHIPESLWRRSGQDDIGRISYANEIYMWIGLSLFRHWFTQSVIERHSRLCRDGGASFYRAIGEGGASYMDARDYCTFHNICPMTPKARTILYDKIRQIKFDVRRFVQCLLVNESQLDGPVDHLTCCKVDNQDMPWVVSSTTVSEDEDEVAAELSSSDEEMDDNSSEAEVAFPEDVRSLMYATDLRRGGQEATFPEYYRPLATDVAASGSGAPGPGGPGSIDPCDDDDTIDEPVEENLRNS